MPIGTIPCKERSLDIVKELFDVLNAASLGKCHLFTGISSYRDVLSRLNVTGSNLKPDGNTLQLPVVEFPARGIVIAIIPLYPDSGVDQGVFVLLAGGVKPGPLFFFQVDSDSAGNDNNLLAKR